MRMKIKVICDMFGQQTPAFAEQTWSNLQAILYLRNEGTLGYKGKELSFDFEREWDDEENKDDHLYHQQKEDLSTVSLARELPTLWMDTTGVKMSEGILKMTNRCGLRRTGNWLPSCSRVSS